MSAITYPIVKRDDSVVDEHFGIKVVDPYRWLEDTDSEETKKFVVAQNAITDPYISSCSYKEDIKANLTKIWNFERFGNPLQRGNSYFYFHNSGLQNQSVLYKLDGLHGKPETFFDPNELDENGLVSLRGYSFSFAGKYLCYGLSYGGSDWSEIKFRSTDTGEDLPDTLKNVKFSSMAWTHDETGLFYNVFPTTGKSAGTETTVNQNQMLMYHRLGTDQSQDVLCLERPDQPTWIIGAEVSECGRYVLVTLHESCESKNQLFFCDLKAIDYNVTAKLDLVPVVDEFEAAYEYVTNQGSLFTFRTNLDAPMYRLINIDLATPEKKLWKDLIPHHDSILLEAAFCVNNRDLIVCQLKDVKSCVSIYDLITGEKRHELDFPLGYVCDVSGRASDTMAFFHFVSFLNPGTIFMLDLTQKKLELEVFRSSKVNGVDLKDFEEEQVFYNSSDGTKIPMFIVKPKSFRQDGNAPCLLYGYGGFDTSCTPSFSVSRIFFMQHFGGICAVANIRGGGEYGERWYRAGRRETKQNSFDDFNAGAEYLFKNKYTNQKMLIIQGGSNGGMLVCACCNQRPDLYAAVIAQVPVCDLVRFHKFTIGHAWTSDYGYPDREDDFKTLIKYSPLHNVRVPTAPGVQYPAMLLLTADHDDRVVPLHSFKLAATLQHKLCLNAREQKQPLLIRIETKTGHGAGKPTSMRIEESVAIIAFIQVALNLKWIP